MHLESKFAMSLVFVTTFFFCLFFLFLVVLVRHLVVQTDFEFKISGPLGGGSFNYPRVSFFAHTFSL